MMLTMAENEVRALYDKLIAAWNDQDGDAMTEPFAADGVVIGFDGSVSSGTQTISTDLSNIFADHETGHYAVKVHSVRPLGAAAAPPVWKPVSHNNHIADLHVVRDHFQRCTRLGGAGARGRS